MSPTFTCSFRAIHLPPPLITSPHRQFPAPQLSLRLTELILLTSINELHPLLLLREVGLSRGGHALNKSGAGFLSELCHLLLISCKRIPNTEKDG